MHWRLHERDETGETTDVGAYIVLISMPSMEMGTGVRHFVRDIVKGVGDSQVDVVAIFQTSFLQRSG